MSDEDKTPLFSVSFGYQGGSYEVSGPDGAWVAKQAELADQRLSRVPTRRTIGFEAGGSAQIERADPHQPNYWLGEEETGR